MSQPERPLCRRDRVSPQMDRSSADHAAEPGLCRVYAYSRLQVEPGRKVAGRLSTGRVVKDAGEWLVRCPADSRPTLPLRSMKRTSPGWLPTGRPPGRARPGRFGAAVRATALQTVRRPPHDGPLPRRISQWPRCSRMATRAPSTRSTTGPVGLGTHR
jgi:hypothetical protein